MKTAALLSTAAIVAAAAATAGVSHAAKCTDAQNDAVLAVLTGAAQDYDKVCDWKKDLCDQSDDCLGLAFLVAAIVPDCEAIDGTNYFDVTASALTECFITYTSRQPSSTAAAATAATAAATTKPAITTKPASNVTTTPVYQPANKCWGVSVERDATYCIDGPICSGNGAKPAGTNCPKKGAVAIADCKKNVKSYVDVNKCVLPADSVCQKIQTGAWGCVLPSSTPTPAPTTVLPSSTKPATPAPTTNKPAY